MGEDESAYSSLVLDLPNRRVHLGTAETVLPNAMIELTTADANRYWQGALNLTLALAEGRVRISGAVASLLRDGAATRQLQAAYLQNLRKHGRHDLIVRQGGSSGECCAYHAS